MSVFCHHCGKVISEGVKRCNHCGASLNGQTASSPATIVEPFNKLPDESSEELLEKAMKWAEHGAYDDAILLCRRAIGINEGFVAAYAFLGEMYGKVGEKDKALKAFEQALKLDKYYEPAKLGMERLLHQQPQNLPVNISYETQSFNIWSGHPLPLLAATALVTTVLFGIRAIVPPTIKSEVNHHTQPIAITSTQKISPPHTVPSSMKPEVKKFMQDGLKNFNAGNYEGAIHQFKEAIRLEPSNNEAKSWLALAQASVEEQKRKQKNYFAQAVPPVTFQPNPYESFPSKPIPSGPINKPAPANKPEIVHAQPSPSSANLPKNPLPSSSKPLAPSSPQPSPAIVKPNVVSDLPEVSGREGDEMKELSVNLPPSVEKLESQAMERIYDGDLSGAAKIYRTILSRNLAIEKEGAIRQSLALTLQRMGRYNEAAEEYTKAISAYQQQMERGIQVESAKQGIEACRRGLEICRRAP